MRSFETPLPSVPIDIMRSGDAIRERLRQKQEQKKPGGNGRKEGNDRDNELDAQRKAICASRKHGFAGVGKLLVGAERTLLIMLLHGFVHRSIFEDRLLYKEIDTATVPLFEILTPHQQLSIIATIARGLLLPGTPLPPDDRLHWAGFIFLYEQLETFLEIEIDMSDEMDGENETKPKINSTYDKDSLQESTDKWMEEAAISAKETKQSLRRQKQLASIVKEDEAADLEEIMKKQLQMRDLKENKTTMNDIPQHYGKAMDTAISTDKLYWFCWRRALVHFVTERGEKYLEDGRLVNLWVIAKGQRIPIETEGSNEPWDLLLSHIKCELIVLSEEDNGFLYGRITEETWARTALIRKTARHAHHQFAPTWSFKQGLHELATILMLTDPSPYALEYIHETDIGGSGFWLFDESSRAVKPINMLPQDTVDYFAQQTVESTTAAQTGSPTSEEGTTNSGPLGGLRISSAESEQEKTTRIKIRALQGRLARNWTWHWHRMMGDADVGFDYASNEDRICALDR